MNHNMGVFVNGKCMFIMCFFLVLYSICELCMCDVTCDFNNGKMCKGWQFEHNSSAYAANWTIWKGPTQTTNTGPSGDRSNKDGYYIYMETTKQKNSDIAIFYTPVLHSMNKVVNASFWYHMHGIFIQSLKLYIIADDIKSEGQKLIKAIVHEQGNAWKFGTVMFEQQGPFRLAFQAMVGSTFSDIAVDEISIGGTEMYVSTVLPLIIQSTLSYTISDSVSTINNSTTDFVPVPYIIICSIGALLWLIILTLLCYCIYRAYSIGTSKRNIACNTTVSIEDKDNIYNGHYKSDDYHEEDTDTVSNEDIELVLDARRLTNDHIIITTDDCGTKL